ncbi:MAG: hypothetical protein II558_02115, partial [Treponema sp.]|nr:hypothetical protein [Treponema sp.]
MASTVFNLDVNNFPSLTWHHLHINHGHMEASLSSAADASVRGTGGGITFAKVLEGASSLNPKASSIETQMGKEFDKAFDSFAKEKNLPLNLFTVNAGSQNQSPVNVSFDIADCSQTAADFFIDAGDGTFQLKRPIRRRVNFQSAPRLTEIHCEIPSTLTCEPGSDCG